MTVSQKDFRTIWGMGTYGVLSLISMATMSIGAAIVILGILFERGGIRRFVEELGETWRSSPWFRRYVGASAILCLACLLSLISAEFFPLTYGGRTASVNWPGDLGKTWYFLLPIVLLVGWRRLAESERAQVLRAWLIGFGLLSALGVPQLFTGWPKAQPNPLLPGYFHTILLLGHHLSVASIWIFPFFAALDLSTDRESLGQLRLPRPVIFTFLALGFFTLVFTYSRTLWVALPLGLGLWVLGKLPRKAGATLLGLMTFALIGLSQTPIFERRIQNSMGVGERIMLWKANLVFFESRPVFGVGLGKNLALSENYQRWLHPESTDYFVGHAHSIYLEILAGLGAFGMIAWLLWVSWILIALFRVRRMAKPLSFPWGMACAWAVFLLNGTTQVNFWEGKVLHQLMWSVALTLFWVGGPGKLNSVTLPGPATRSHAG